MKKQIILSFLLLCTLSTDAINYQLQNPLLTAADNAGFFDPYIITILQTRKKIQELISGKYIWHGYKLQLATTSGATLSTLLKKPELIYGLTYVVIAPEHPNVLQFTTQENLDKVKDFYKEAQSRSLVERQQHPGFESVFTGSYAIHPITNEHLPIFLADYNSEYFDTRTTHAHLAIPAHDQLDFNFAQKHHLPIRVVIVDHETDNIQSLEGTYNHKHLTKPYTKQNDECTLINSDFLNGPVRQGVQKIIHFLQSNNLVTEYKENLTYHMYGKAYSIENLSTIQAQLQQDKKNLSPEQQMKINMLMNYAQADFLEIVEQFLESVKKTKDLMVELITQSCEARSNKESFLLHWSKHNTAEGEKTLFKKNITSFTSFSKFCTDLVNFLGDLAHSCPHALEKLKTLKDK